MLKKLSAVLCIFALLVMCTSCKMPERCDWSQLIYMADRYCKEADIDINDSFFSEGQWFLFLSFSGTENIIVTADEDEENLLITSFSVSVLNTEVEGQEAFFLSVAESFVKAFCGKENASALLEGVSFYKENALFSEETYFFEAGRYSVSFFNADIGSSIICELLY